MRLAIPSAPLLLSAFVLAALPGTALASSVIAVPAPAASASAQAAAETSPAACAGRFHARFETIRTGPFAALREAARAPAEAPAESDAGRDFVFAPETAGRSREETAALRSARRFMTGGGANASALDANGRWIAARIREDLGDFLGQGPSPFLCAGIENYLASLGRYADQIRVSPERRERDEEAQREVARRAFAAATAALRPVPLPRFAPADRPGEGPVADSLHPDPAGKRAETFGPPMRLAARADAPSQVSEGGYDPDLPPLRAVALRDEGDMAALAARLAAAIVASHPLRPGEAIAAGTDAMTTGSVETAAAPRLRERLERMAPTVASIEDARARARVTAALGEIEALDALRRAAAAPASPYVAALDETFAAIRAAHAQACGCTPPQVAAE